jgi:WD40 repeat protein
LEKSRFIRFFGNDGESAGIACFSPDGAMLLTTGADYAIRLWDVRTGVCKQKLHGHILPILDISFICGGAKAYSFGRHFDSVYHIGKLWDLDGGHRISFNMFMSQHNGMQVKIIVAPERDVIFSLSDGVFGNMYIGKRTITKQPQYRASPSLSSIEDAALRLSRQREFETLAEKAEAACASGDIGTAAKCLSNISHMDVYGHEQRLLLIEDTVSKRCEATGILKVVLTKTLQRTNADTVVFCGASELQLSNNSGYAPAQLWDVRTGQLRCELSAEVRPFAEKGRARIKKPRRELPAEERPTSGEFLSPDGKFVASVESAEGLRLVVRRVDTGEIVGSRKCDGHLEEAWINHIAFGHDGKHLFQGDGYHIIIYRLPSLEPIESLLCGGIDRKSVV